MTQHLTEIQATSPGQWTAFCNSCPWQSFEYPTEYLALASAHEHSKVTGRRRR